MGIRNWLWRLFGGELSLPPSFSTFISYRREDTGGIAGRVHERLATRYGRGAVFIDFDAIPFGTDFRDKIQEAVGQCHCLLALIGDRWLAAEKGGQQRLNDPSDFVRIEIAAALAKDIPVVPVLVGAAVLPEEGQLPPDLKPLAFRNATPLDPGRDFHSHLDRLILHLDALLGGPIRPVPTSEKVLVTPPCHHCVRYPFAYQVEVTSAVAREGGWAVAGRGQIRTRSCPMCAMMYTAVARTIPIECSSYPCPRCGENTNLRYKVEKVVAKRQDFTFEASIICDRCLERREVRTSIKDILSISKVTVGPADVVMSQS